MIKRAVLSFLIAAFAGTISALADQTPTYSGPLSPSETAFVQSIQADLMKRFPTAQDAVKEGYVRYTDEDETGAISYANRQWNSPDIRHPSQLWYDKNGHLLGADFSTLKTSDTRPELFGVNPGRLYEFDDHVHYVVLDSKGDPVYGQAVMANDFKAAGGDPQHPTAQQLVTMGRAQSTSQIVTVFEMPSIWDIIVWVKPNPAGPFAWKNPTVTP
jgi:hypothetical protein